MPEHVHLLVNPLDPEPDLGRDRARIKQPLSKQLKEMLVRHGSRLLEQPTAQERPGKNCFRFWQEGPGFDRHFLKTHAIMAAIDDTHQKPVRRG